jgi:putative transposase
VRKSQITSGIDTSKVNAALLKKLGAIPVAELPRMAGMDLGVNNLLAIAYSHGKRSMVLSNARIEKRLQHFDRLLDQRKSALTTPELRRLQAKREKESLTPGELTALKTGLKAIYADADYIRLTGQRSTWLSDVLHKVSAGVVDALREAGSDVLVIGLNQQWKTEVSMGRKQNRRFMAAAHTRLIELLKYKCLEAGILVVTTEESYTSKTSFALNEPLQEKAGNKASKKTSMLQATESTAEDMPPAQSETLTGKSKVKLKVRRGEKEKRHFFTTPGLTGWIKDNWSSVHADLNGAYNMLRKVFPDFACHGKLHSQVWLHWLSPKLGLTSMRLQG